MRTTFTLKPNRPLAVCLDGIPPSNLARLKIKVTPANSDKFKFIIEGDLDLTMEFKKELLK